MRILHINTESNKGGAGIAAYRHCEAMSRNNIEAHLLSLGTSKNNQLVQCISKNKKIELYKYLQSKVIRFVRHRIVWTTLDFGYDISNFELVKNADIIYIHWIDGLLNFDAIDCLLKTKKPIVWYMHDMEPFTGGCHYSFDCKGYETDCGRCPQLRFMKILSKIQLKKKIQHWRKYDNFYLAAPSNWLVDCIRNSALFKDNKVFVCTNVIDTDYFKPIDKEQIRKELGLPTDKKLILFSVMGLKNPYKGVKYLFDALSKLNDSDYECLVLGTFIPEQIPTTIKIKMHLMGYIKEQKDMCKIYNASDVLVITSMAENFPNVIIEAMACGIPAVGFATGGIVDQIHHKENGYLVQPRDVEGLIEGINWVLNTEKYSDLSDKARTYIIDHCSYKNILNNHKELLNL